MNGVFVAEAMSLRPRPMFPVFALRTGDADDPTMKKLLLLAPLAVLIAACSSSSGPSALSGPQPMVYASSQRSPSFIAQCLASRLSAVHTSKHDGATELSVGPASNSAYLVTLTPSGSGSVIKVVRPAGGPDDPSEPEMRFSIARCVT